LGGVQRYASSDPNSDIATGQLVGDVVTLAIGSAEQTLGGGGEVGGFALDLTGVGALGGVPLQVVSAGAIAHGTLVNAHAANNLGKALSNISFSKGETDNGTQVTSKTLWKDKKSGLRIDVGKDKGDVVDLVDSLPIVR
jgi:hypothetical protein